MVRDVYSSLPEWMRDARVKCKGMIGYMYPNRPSSEVSLAKAVCNGLDGSPPCAMRTTCLHHAIDHSEQFGVWGGMSERDRRKIKRARKKAKTDNNPHWQSIYTLEDVRFPGVVVVIRRKQKGDDGELGQIAG
jgi:3,4-dihydroxy-2-butanone 4-phosphate synthase